MNRLNTLILSSIFAATVNISTINHAQAQTPQVIDGKSHIKTDFSGLKDINGAPVDMNDFKNKIVVVYFGTAYKSPSCESFFGTQGLAFDLLKKSCPDIGNNIAPVFICPFVDDGKNENNIAQAKRFGFTVLRGNLSTVESLAKKYNAQFFDYDKDGAADNHTNYMYVQNTSGENIVIIHGNSFSYLSAKAISDALKKDNYTPAIDCGL